jgi:phospholipid transport system substrate-binding protein
MRSSTAGEPTCRREVIRRAVIAGLLMTLGRGAMAQSDQDTTAVDFIRQAGNQLQTLAAAAAAPGADRQPLQAFIDRVVDVDGVARFCLGRFWTNASGSQQRTYLVLFHRVLLRNVISWLGNHPEGSAHVTIERPLVAGEDIQVPTVVERPGVAPVHVTWIVTTNLGQPKIVDAIVEGVSMRLTVRNDYASFIEHNNGDIGALLQGLQRQAEAG